ncbi:cytochrome P450, partial [Epithele typhae]|uniref:cytochrome P450 n=1 Tax=Epithele typhae TaxID=378194 RepID=UPI002007F0FF
LATEPVWVKTLRAEIEPIITEGSWTKNAITEMWKFDSTFRESQRVNGISVVSLTCLVLNDITLADGAFIPKGKNLATSSIGTHFDDGILSGAVSFDSFRHMWCASFLSCADFAEADSMGQIRNPGRFFASNELKVLIAYILINYDFKLAEGTLTCVAALLTSLA